MPATHYIHTPATNDASYLHSGLDRLGELSPEKSFFAPQQNGDIISQMKSARRNGMNLKTPGAGMREPLRVLPNGNQGKSEFTPLMKSVTKHNMARRLSGRKPGQPDTPIYLKEGSSLNGATPALPRMDENSQLQSEHTASSAGGVNDFTPIPQNVSSSTHSTPLAQLPGRDGGGVVSDGNMMTLREQENIIDKIEKENFGLKMKIHFLEEALSKRGSEFNQAALKENTDLKVNRISMQRELHKFKKNIAQAERDAEMYRLQLEEYRQRVKQKQADESMRLEMERMQSDLQAKEAEIERLQAKLGSAKSSQEREAEKLRDDIEDLQAELREKERQLEERDDQMDEMKMSAHKDSNAAAELEDELKNAKQQIEELKEDLERANEKAQEAKEDREEAIEEKRKAEEDLEELRDEMANKSFTTKGLSRQLEEKANKLDDDLQELQERYEDLKEKFEDKSQAERKLQERVRELEKEGASENRQVQQDLQLVQQQHETAERKLANMSKQSQTLENELQVKTEEKDLLQTRHDALTTESAQLQRDLSKARKNITELEAALDEERQRAAQNDLLLRTQQRQEVDILNEQIDSLHREVNAKDSELASQQEEWEAQRRTIETASQRAEEKAAGLQRTVDKLQDPQGTPAGKQTKLQQALESEKQRHQQEEKVLLRQIEELNADLAAKRTSFDDNRNELNNAKEELRISIREQAALKEKIAELEEEIEVLQADIEDEHNFAEQLQKKNLESNDSHFEKIRREKQTLQDQLANVNIELHNARRAAKSAESERDELEAKLQNAERAADDTFNADSEKRELRRMKQKLEKELERMKSERDSLQQINQNLEDEINAEVDRANAEERRLNVELDLFRNKQTTASETRDRELTSAKNKVARLEARVAELDNQTKIISSPVADISGLKADLEQARANETAAAKREAELRTANRKLSAEVHDLEKELHEARLAQFKLNSRSPSTSPRQAVKEAEELAKVRQELVEARAEMKQIQTQNRDLRRTERNRKVVEVDDTERADLHKLVKERVIEAESLRGELGEKDRKMEELRSQIRRLREERRHDHQHRHPDGDVSLKLSVRDVEAKEMKGQLQRLREERSIANKKAEAVEYELEILQGRYESMLEKLAEVAGRRDGMERLKEKEMKGLVREIGWFKGALKREKQLRESAGWAKEWVERREEMRVRCNEVDLKILREMGVEIDRRKYEKPLTPVQKLRAGVFVVIAAVRMRKLEEQWRGVREMGVELGRIKRRTKQIQSPRNGEGRRVREV